MFSYIRSLKLSVQNAK